MNSAPDAKIALQFDEAAGDNREGLDPSLLDLFCNFRESTLLGQITAILTESGYHGALLVKRLEEFRESQYFRDLIEDYRAHISRVGQVEIPDDEMDSLTKPKDCRCDYDPISRVYRSGSGHVSGCPVHERWLEKMRQQCPEVGRR